MFLFFSVREVRKSVELLVAQLLLQPPAFRRHRETARSALNLLDCHPMNRNCLKWVSSIAV